MKDQDPIVAGLIEALERCQESVAADARRRDAITMKLLTASVLLRRAGHKLRDDPFAAVLNDAANDCRDAAGGTQPNPRRSRS